MKKISLVTSKMHLNNKIFSEDPILNFDNLLYFQRLFRECLFHKGYDLSTYDINAPEVSDYIFYIDYYKGVPEPKSENFHKNILFLWECEIIAPLLYNKELHEKFSLIFTFCDDLVDNKKYFKINYNYLFPDDIRSDISQKTKLCTMISGNKRINHKNELYSERLEVIKWFDKNYFSDFDFYGRGWRDFSSPNKWMNRIYNRVPFCKSIFDYVARKRVSRCYKGEVISKGEVLPKYKFAICYENTDSINGYITEKIFHCFFNGIVPIYLGAPNILDHIPGNCFIDRRKFESMDELYVFLHNMSDDLYNNYLTEVRVFLNNSNSDVFNAKFVVKSVISEIFKDR